MEKSDNSYPEKMKSAEPEVKTSFVKQAGILAGAGLISRFLGFLYRMPLTALIGDVGNSIYAAGYNIYNFLLILSSAGIPAAISRMVSERIALKKYKSAHEVFKVALMFSGGLGLIFMIVLFVFAKPICEMINSPDSYYTLLTLAPTVFIVSIMATIRGYFQGMRKMKPTALSQIVEQIFHVISSIILAYFLVKKSVALGAAGGTAGTGIGAVFGLLVMLLAYKLIREDIKRRAETKSLEDEPESRKEIFIKLICTVFPIIAGTAIFSITNMIDMTMVLGRLQASGVFTEMQAQELYGQLSGKYVVITTLPVSISTAIATASIPNIAASMAIGDKKQMERKMNLSFKLGMVISIPAAVGIGVLGDQILQLLYPSYPGGGLLLRLGALSIVFLALCQMATGFLQGIGKVHIPVIGAACGAAVKILLNYLLIVNPEINVYGAVISTTACYAVASALNFFAIHRATGIKPNYSDMLLKPSIAAVIMGAACILLYKGIFSLGIGNAASTLITIVIAMGIYAAGLLLLKGITEEEVLSMPKGRKLHSIFKKFRLI
ncbi:MAG: polysaccharide biosynthesis protein [Firmicutes bacterium]|nr:polysaccharide biosynthesis protein [Bacillota bacterium]